MIYLSADDITRAVTLNAVVDAMEAAMRLSERGTFHMPPRAHIDHGPNTLLLMPCFLEDCFATKLVTLFPDNPSRGAPVLNGIVVLNDGQTGRPLALLDGPTLTAVRTAAVAAVSIRHFAREDVTTLGIVGAGVQAYYQARTACAVRDFKAIHIYDIDPDRTGALIARLADGLPGCALHRADSSQAMLAASEVVIAATTARDPVLPDDPAMLEGRHIVAIGSYQPHVRELPDAVFSLIDRVFIDTEHALAESGDLMIPLDRGLLAGEQIVTMGKFLTGEAPPPERSTTLFKSVGMALFDVCAAKLVYEAATEKALGQTIET